MPIKSELLAFRECRSSVRRGLLRITSHRLDSGTRWSNGDYAHPAGMVTILRQEPDRGFPNGYTRLDAIVGGKLIYRTWEHHWADRAIPKLARELLGAE